MASEADDQVRRFEEKQSCFRGSAKIHLKHLKYENVVKEDDRLFLDPKNIARLIQVYQLEGCLRLDIEHHVPAIIKEKDLQTSLKLSNVDPADLFKRGLPPELEFSGDVTLVCLHGRHRLEAAKEFLLPGDKWWIVDLYSESLTDKTKTDIRQDYANARKFCDGDIYRQLRFSQQRHDSFEEGRWMARLSESGRKDIKQLQTRHDLQPLTYALDELLPYIGLWPALQIGTFHRIINLKCPEELRNYLLHVRSQWDYILGHSVSMKALIDYKSVQLLQMRSPASSPNDATYVQDLMNHGILFPLILDNNIRQHICGRILRVSCMITSLYTFLEDTKWLEPCAKVVRGLLPSRFGPSIRIALFKKFAGNELANGFLKIEDPAFTYSTFKGNEHQAVQCGYIQLWMAAWRGFPDMVSIAPRKDVGKPKPQVKALNEHYWNRLAKMAVDLGFASEEINRMQAMNTDWMMTQEFLRKLRPSEFFQISNDELMSWTTSIWQIIDRIRPRTNDEASHLSADLEVPVEYRCGRPHENAHIYSRGRFFMSNIYGLRSTSSTSHFGINRDIFRAFFGHDSPLSWESPDHPKQSGPPKTTTKIPQDSSRVSKPKSKLPRPQLPISKQIQRHIDNEKLKEKGEPMIEDEDRLSPKDEFDEMQNIDSPKGEFSDDTKPLKTLEKFISGIDNSVPTVSSEPEMPTSVDVHMNHSYLDSYSYHDLLNPKNPAFGISAPLLPQETNVWREEKSTIAPEKGVVEESAVQKGDIVPEKKTDNNHSRDDQNDKNDELVQKTIDEFCNDWEKNREKGKLLLVDTAVGQWWPSMTVETTNVWFAQRANDFYFCVENSATNQLETISLFQWAKFAYNPEEHKNGVIYAFRNSASKNHTPFADKYDSAPQQHGHGYQFESTKQMLKQIVKNRKIPKPFAYNLNVSSRNNCSDEQKAKLLEKTSR